MTELNRIREIYSTQPFLHWIGIEILDAGPGWVHERLAVRPEFFQPDVVHGGVIYTLADTVAAHSVLTMVYPEEWITTVEQKINFLRPVAAGAMVATARVVQLGSRIAYSEAEISIESGKLIAKSSATLMRLPRK
jgi:acyl-CoA thioesterase